MRKDGPLLMRKESPLRVIAQKTVSLDKEEKTKKEERNRRQELKRQALQKEFYKDKLQVLQGQGKKLQVLQGKEKLQAIVRKANGDLDFPGEHFPPSLIYMANGTNRSLLLL